MTGQLNFQETKKMNNPSKLGLAALLLLLSYATGRYLQPARVETKTEIVVKEVEVIKRDIERIKKKKTNADGSTEEEETTRDRSTENRNKDQSDRTSTVVTNEKPQWRLYGQAGYSFKDQDYVYGAGFEKRYMGPVSLGLWGNNKETAGLSVSVEF